MRAPGSVGGATLRLLLASTSVVALLIGGGVPHAYACSISENGATVASVSNGGNIDCISIVNTTVSGNVTNSVGGTSRAPATAFSSVAARSAARSPTPVTSPGVLAASK